MMSLIACKKGINLMKMNKKIIFAILFFTLFLMLLPLLLTGLFSNQKSGKIEVNQKIEASYLTSTKEFMLVYFGYVGCTRICTPILHNLNSLYRSTSFLGLEEKVDFCFVNLKEEVEYFQPAMFAKAFNPEFKGYYLTRKEIMSIDREFNLYFSRTLGDDHEIDHSDYLYLVQRQPNGALILRSIYSTHPINDHAIMNDIHALQREAQ